MLILRPIRHPGRQIGQRVWVQVRVGVHRYDERCLDRVEHGVEGVKLPRFGLEYAAIGEPQSNRDRLCDLGGAVGRVVVRQHDLHIAWVRRFDEPLERGFNHRLLVPRRDDNGEARPLPDWPPAGRWVKQKHVVRAHDQGGSHEPDHQPRNVRQHDRDHPGRHWVDRLFQIVPPRL
jgi:hypothetical protein